MEDALRKRIETSWDACKSWIAEFDGSPNVALLVEIPIATLLSNLNKLSKDSEQLRITRIALEKASAPEFIPLEAFPQEIAKLQANQVAELCVNFAAHRAAFDLDLHMVIHPVKDNKAALELIWWGDQVFSSETDHPAQFQALATYFIELQTLFEADGLFISPESGLRDEEMWVEI